MDIAGHVLSTYRTELLSRKQIAYEGHVFLVIDDWDIPNGKHVYDVLDTLAMKHYSIYEEVKK